MNSGGSEFRVFTAAYEAQRVPHIGTANGRHERQESRNIFFILWEAELVIDADWDQRINDFYEHDFDESDPQNAISRMRSLVADRPAGDAAAMFEMGGVYDSLGLELEAAPMSAVDEPARQAFLALALYDEGRYGDALRTALLALVPTLESYQRSLRGYAGELPSTESDSSPRVTPLVP